MTNSRTSTPHAKLATGDHAGFDGYRGVTKWEADDDVPRQDFPARLESLEVAILNAFWLRSTAHDVVSLSVNLVASCANLTNTSRVGIF